MALTAQGFAGTVDEVAVANMDDDNPARVISGFLPTPVSGSRAVAVPVGTSVSHGVFVAETAGVQRNYATPTNGQWYLLCLRRTWNGQGVTATVGYVDIAGPATAAGPDPTNPPATFPTINSNPGVIEDQPLAWVWVSGTASKVFVWDARISRSRTGGVFVASPVILQAYHAAGMFGALGVIGVGQFDATYTGSSDASLAATVRQSIWWRRGGSAVTVSWLPVRPLRVTSAASLTALTALLQPLANVGLTGHDYAFSEADSIVYRYVGPGNTNLGALGNGPSPAWQAWELAAQAWSMSGSNLGWPGNSPTSGLYGIAAGVAWFKGHKSQTGTGNPNSASGDTTFALPTPVVAGLGIGNGWLAKGGTQSDQGPYDLACRVGGTAGLSASALIVRGRYATAAGAGVREAYLATIYGTGASGDYLELDFSAPSALSA